MITINTQLPFKGVMTSFIGGRKENQDSCGFSDTPRGLLLVVCDGMGGGPGGKTASSIAAATIIAYVQRACSPTEKKTEGETSEEETTETGTPEADIDNETLLRDAVKAANKALRDKIEQVPELRGMGTTATAVLLSPENAAVAHVGDSRIYKIHRRKIAFRTADHSKVGEMVRAKALSEEQARLSAISNIITRALGIGDEVEVDTDSMPYDKGDRFVLCTDGIWGAMPQPELVKMLSADKTTLEVVADEINKKVEEAGELKGGKHDNYTMIIAQALQASEEPAAETDVEETDDEEENDSAKKKASKSKKNKSEKSPKGFKIDTRVKAFAITVLVAACGLFFLLKPANKLEEPAPMATPPAAADSTGIDSSAIIEKPVVEEPKADEHKQEETPKVEAPKEEVKKEETNSNIGGREKLDSTIIDESSSFPENISATPSELYSFDDLQLAKRKEALDLIISSIRKIEGYRKALYNARKATSVTTNKNKSEWKQNIRDILDDLEVIEGYTYTEHEHDWLFRSKKDEECKKENKPNGIRGAIGGQNLTTDGDAGFDIVDKIIKKLLKSLEPKLNATEAEIARREEQQEK